MELIHYTTKERLDFSIARERKEIAPITLDAVYYVFANPNYHIHHTVLPGTYILVATLSGQGVIHIHHHQLSLTSGDITLIDASHDTFHYFSAGSNWNFFWFEFRCLTPDFLEFPLEQVAHLPLDTLQRTLCEKCLNSLKLGDSKTASHLLTSLLCLLQSQNRITEDYHSDIDRFRKADEFIRQHLNTATVQSTARHLNISERSLLNTFQSLLGVRTIEYIQTLKMDTARYLLLNDSMSIRKISEHLGYADQFIFSKSFHKLIGLSPTQYRRQCK